MFQLNFLLLFLFFIAIFISRVIMLPKEIRIGAIFLEAQKNSKLELAFKFAIKKINDDPTLLPNSILTNKIKYVKEGGNFLATKLACSHVEGGVMAIFGPQDPFLGSNIQSICDAFDIPNMESRFEYQTGKIQPSINVFPNSYMMNTAYSDMLRFLNWTQTVAIIYEEEFSLINLMEVLRTPMSKKGHLMIRQSFPETYREVLKEFRAKQYYDIIIDTTPTHIHLLLKEILRLQMNDYKYHYFFTALDAGIFELEDFLYNYVNMTAFRIVDTNSPFVQTTMKEMEDYAYFHGRKMLNKANVIEAAPALMFDSVYALAHGLNASDRGSPLNNPIDLSCSNESTWTDGSSLYNYINTAGFQGLTGRVQFKEGRRTNFTLDVMKLNIESLIKVGEWRQSTGVKLVNEKAFYEGGPNVTLKVVILLVTPFFMTREDKNLTGNDRYYGYGADLIRLIADILGFKYELFEVEDKNYGMYNTEAKEWNGLIRELIDKNADLALTALTITYAREEVVDFTKAFMNTGISILFKLPTESNSRLFTFMSPLAIDIWLYVLASYVLVSITMFVVARFSPYEWRNPHPCISENDVIENQFSLGNSFWFTMGTLMQQGSDLTPKATSTRIVGSIWWFFTTIIISSYTANLAAFLTVERMITPIQSFEDLAEQTKIPYGTRRNGSTMTYFRDHKMERNRKMWSFMSSQSPSVFVSSYDDGIKRVHKGNYAFLMESTMLDYVVQRDCSLTQIGGVLDSKGYGIGTPRGSPWTEKISLEILRLQEKGILEGLYNKWWKDPVSSCNREEVSTGRKASFLGVESIGGVFVVLLCGLAFAVLVSVAEFCWKSKKNALTDHQSVCSEMATELKFALRCKGSRQRPALRRKCSKCMPGTTYVPSMMDLPQENGVLQMLDLQPRSPIFDCNSHGENGL